MCDGKSKGNMDVRRTDRQDGGGRDEGWTGGALSGDETGGEDMVLVCLEGRSGGRLTYANILIVQFCRGIAVVAQLALLAVLPPCVVLTADANDRV